jgi:hypothetical protein
VKAPICDSRSRQCLRIQSLIRALIGFGCLRVALALSAGTGPGTPRMATAVNWVVCTASLILVALLDRDFCKQYPGIRSLYRGCSYVGIAGSWFPTVMASLLPAADFGAALLLAGALAGLAMALSTAALMAWLVSPVPFSGRPALPSERLLVEHLSALVGVLRRC